VSFVYGCPRLSAGEDERPQYTSQNGALPSERVSPRPIVVKADHEFEAHARLIFIYTVQEYAQPALSRVPAESATLRLGETADDEVVGVLDHVANRLVWQ